jgi:hypothetical protein
MARRGRTDESTFDDEVVMLQLAAPERKVIVSSAHVTDRALVDRIRDAPPRKAISFRFEELEELHVDLIAAEGETRDGKRKRTIGQILDKIEELLDIEDSTDEWEPDLGDEGELFPSIDPGELFHDLLLRQAGDSAEPITCRVVLTSEQRERLRHLDAISLDVHRMLSVESPEECAFEFNVRQVLGATLAVKEALDSCADKDAAKPLLEISERISAGLFAVIVEGAPREVRSRLASLGAPAPVAYQLKITLEGSKPPIWRRVQVADCTLGRLHQILQIAMGWTNSHLHMFEYGNDRFSDPQCELDAGEDETQVYLSQLVANGCGKLRYCYDFGDDWWHTIKIEKTLEPKPGDEYPSCMAGRGACPPEDVGGMWGYYEFLVALRDPKHERHAEVVEWWGPSFNADSFDRDEVNQALRS